MRKQVLEIVREESGKPEVTYDTKLEDLDLDSLEFVELMTRIGRECADVPDAEWAKLKTVDDVAKAVAAKVIAG